eukprot:13535945-Ditylum_brightwellii.AAC.1
MPFSANVSRVVLLVEKQCRKREDKRTNPTVVSTNFTCPCLTSQDCQVPISAASAKSSFGFSDDEQKKSNFQILIGATALDASIGVSGSASVSANVGDVIEVEADLSASLGVDVALSINRNRPFISINEWLIQVKNITDPEIEGFGEAKLACDGSFEAEVTAKAPFPEITGSFTGKFTEPYVIDIIDVVRNRTLLPQLNDKISFGVVALLEDVVEFLVGSEEDGHS